jgi:2-amino-4-hydroxy-6-hydroxymethyldihydropteridine diphosphokinase
MNLEGNTPFRAQPLVTAYVSIGSNIDAESNVQKALQEIAKQVPVTAISTLYQTQFLKPDGTVSAKTTDLFVNGVFAVETVLSPHDFREHVLRRVEISMGRLRNSQRFDARKIDLDLVLYGTLVLDEANLRIPRIDIRTRDFVAIPLLEIAPQLVLPDTHERLDAIVPNTVNTNMQPLIELTNRVRKDILR